jgi:hypothetical protein
MRLASQLGIAALGLALGTLAACTIIEGPSQCKTDDDCARFDAVCDLGEGVCVEPEANQQSTFASQLDGSAPDARKDASPPGQPGPAPTTTAPPVVDAAVDAAPDARPLATIACGASKCDVAPDHVCCITDTSTCTASADCKGAPVACDTTNDCAALGMAGTICCATNDGNGATPALVKTECVTPDKCDATGPQDQMCKLNGPATQCDTATPGNTACKSFTYSNATYAICSPP